MKYDVYKGTEKDMTESCGELVLKDCNEQKLIRFSNSQRLDYKIFYAGDFANGYWLKAAA
jgi:hypothetical protein